MAWISFMALGCSLMWPALWPLAMADLGKFTKAGSSLLIMAMFGGFLYTDESICLFRTDFVPGYSIIQDEQEAR